MTHQKTGVDPPCFLKPGSSPANRDRKIIYLGTHFVFGVNFKDYKTWAWDIRFWIILFFILRLPSITHPPLEVGHNWRQTTVTMVARNFLETDNKILYPRIDIAGEKTGITGMEFPVLNYLIYLCSLVFGYAHWYGRLLNLIVSSAGVYYFFLLVRKYFDASLAFRSAFLLLLSVWFTYSRKIMPDTFSMSLLLMGFYHGSNYLDRENSLKNILLYSIFVLSGILSKLPVAYLLILFLPFLFNRKIDPGTRIRFAVVTVVVALIVSLYYFRWAPYLTKQFGFNHFFLGKDAFRGFSETMQHLNLVLQKFYEDALGFSGFLIFLAGMAYLIRKKEKQLLYILLLCLLGFLAVIFKAGAVFYRHTYYVIPFVPVMALIAAFALGQIKNRKIVAAILCLFTLEAIVSKNHDFYIKEENRAILRLENALDRLGSKKDLIAINSGLVPTPMYFAHRKGWVESNEALSKPDVVAGMKANGLKFIVVLKRAFGTDITLPYPEVENNSDFRIYALQ